jgi:hypothetical protein
MIDLLDRMITDAKARVSRTEEQRTRPVSPSAAPGSYGAVLREQLARESDLDHSSVSDPPAHLTRQSVTLPRALVLVTTETFCTNCGARVRAPGYAILAEYAFNEVSLCRTMDDVRRHDKRYGVAPTLPREHRTLTVHAPACEVCF